MGVLLLAAVPVAVARRAVMARDAEHLVAPGRDGTFHSVLAESVLGVSDRAAPLVLEP